MQFTRTDPGSPLLVTDLRDVRFLGANQRVSVAYRASPRGAQFAFSGQVYDYGAPSSASGNVLVFGDDARSLQIGPLLAATTQLSPILHSGPAAPGVIVGAGRPLVLALIGNRSTDQAAIATPRLYGGTPGIISSDLLAKPATLSVRSAGQGVSLTLSLERRINNTQQPDGAVNLTGTHDPLTNRLTGVVRDPVNGSVGTFSGALYGPQRELAGVIFEFRRPQNGNVRYIGYLTASLN